MGHKKKNFAPRSKPFQSHSQPQSSPATVVPTTALSEAEKSTTAEPCTTLVKADHHQNQNQNQHQQHRSAESDSLAAAASSYAAVKVECEKALNALRRGNHTKALRLMKEGCARYENSAHAAIMSRVQGTVSVKVASIIDDPNAKQRHLKHAIESARKAVELSPNSLEFAHFYANLLYEAANDGKEYEEVVQECERALAVENPIDPAKDSLQDESRVKASDAEARIVQMQGELRSLIQKSNIASLSNWMKNLGTGEERLKFIPIRRPVEDPMEVRFVQNTRRPNEIKKATKTMEEKRKEIEVRVAAARLLQQKSELPQLQNEGERSGGGEKPVDSSGTGSGQRGERRRRKNWSAAERKDRVQSYWNSMNLEMKKDLLRIKVEDLKAHFGSSKDALANEVFSEALEFAKENKTWKFWSCYKCNGRFVDAESHMQHVIQVHMGNLMPRMQDVLPQNVDGEWIDMILNCSWKPLDISAAVKMLDNRSKSHGSELVEDFYLSNHADVSEDCFRDAWDSSPEKENLGDTFNGGAISECTDKFPSIECKECDGNLDYASSDSWPVADDPERAKILERIHAFFEVLIRHKFLASSHLNRVIQFTIEGLQSFPSGSLLLNHGVNQTPMCICFLGASHLRKIQKYLQDLSHNSGLSRNSEKNPSVGDTISGSQGFEVKENIVLSEADSCLILDENLLQTEVTPGENHNASTGRNENGFVCDTNSLLSWIFGGQTSGEELSSWTRAREEKSQEGLELLQILEKEFLNLQHLCERKCENLGYEEALQAVEDLCLEEGKRRENLAEFRSYESVLRKRREELIENGSDITFISCRFELDILANVLKEAENINANQFGYEDSYPGMSSQLCDLESGEDDDWRTKDYLHQIDTCIEVAIQRQKEHLLVELSRTDAQMMRHVTGMQQLELKLEPVSAYDYRIILIPLVKSYMRAHLEDLAEKDATEKSDAAREAFLAELALDSKKGARGGSDNSKHNQDKAKDRKKNKEHKKLKDSKNASVSDEHDALHGDTEENDSVLVSSDDHQGSEAGISVNGDELKQQEEELRRRMELEAEERKLEETLEYQRQIEEEAKQNHLAKQHKKTGQLHPVKAGGELYDFSMEPSADLARVALKPSQQEQLLHQNGFVNDVASNISEQVASGGHTSTSIHHANMKTGLSNGGASDNGLPFSDQRGGRRSRRQRSLSKPVDGKYQVVSSEKQNAAVGHQLVHADSVMNVGDSGSKTLRQLQAEEDDEERFQADLKKAVRQSLDTYQAHKRTPSSLSTPNQVSLETNGYGDSRDEIENVSGADVFGTGLKNEVGEYNCFLNVIIQSLWHLRRFRDEFLRRSTSEHVHVGDPCVVCALYEIFSALSIASTNMKREAVAPTSLRLALSNLYPDSNFFQEAQMNDASEVLAVIFDCLHRSFTPGLSSSDANLVESNCKESWDCASKDCTVHTLFGMDIFEQMNCYNCGLESRHLKYTSFYHNINASALRTMKVMCPEGSFDELLNLVEKNHQLACDPEGEGCGKLNYIHHILSRPPHVFTTVLGWQNTCESVDDIKATLSALDTEIDVSVLYRGLDPKSKHSLVSVVCYYGQHYHCFAFSHDHEQWIMYDDKTVKVIGGWAEVLSMCERGHLQPQVLFFEAVN